MVWCRTLFNCPPQTFSMLRFAPPPLWYFLKETLRLVHIHNYSHIQHSSINATAWSHSTPQTLTSTSKQILYYNKHLYHSCWYLKGTVYKAVASCENCETISGTIKALWHKSPAQWSMGFVPSGRHTAALGYKSHTTRNPWYNYNFTLYSLQCTPQPTIPTNQSYYSQQQVYTQPFQNNE